MKPVKIIAFCAIFMLITASGFAKLRCYKVKWKNKYNNSKHITYMQAHSKRLAKTKVENNGPTKGGSVKVLKEVNMSHCR